MELDSPGLFWLFKHALGGESALPEHFSVSVSGLALPASLSWLDPHWLNPATFVPFETLGCAAPAFTAADYSRMNVAAGSGHERIEYAYDPAAHSLDLSVTLASTGVANLVLDAELRQFDPRSLQAPDFLDKLHIDQLSVDYTDLGYLQQRNRYCAARDAITPGQFTERHLDAVQNLLQQHAIVAGSELLKLYRQLIEQGGKVSILSLPSRSFAISNWRDISADELLRQLNVTARYSDAPPVMFRLSFAPAAEVTPAEAAPGSTAEAATHNSATAPPAQAADIASISTPGTKPTSVAAIPSVAAQVPAAVPPTATTAVNAVNPLAAATGHAATASVLHDNLGLHGLDRAEARLVPVRLPIVAVPTPLPAMVVNMPELASSPPPPPDSTLALVWKPTIERLPAAAPEQHDYSVIDYTGLKNVLGQRVRLITEGGKRVEGEVLAADDSGVQLRVDRAGGDAQFTVPRARIRQVQLLQRYPPPA